MIIGVFPQLTLHRFSDSGPSPLGVTSALPGVEMLRFSARDPNVIDQYAKYAVKEHGIIGRFVKTDQYIGSAYLSQF